MVWRAIEDWLKGREDRVRYVDDLVGRGELAFVDQGEFVILGRAFVESPGVGRLGTEVASRSVWSHLVLGHGE